MLKNANKLSKFILQIRFLFDIYIVPYQNPIHRQTNEKKSIIKRPIKNFHKHLKKYKIKYKCIFQLLCDHFIFNILLCVYYCYKYIIFGMMVHGKLYIYIYMFPI